MRKGISFGWFLGIVVLLGSTSALAEPITIATWNIEQLRAEVDTGTNRRNLADYARLARYAGQLNADIIALQEVDGEAAAKRVFNENEYAFFFSTRNHTQRTGFAVRKAFTVQQHPDVTALNVSGGLRHGVDIEVTLEGKPVRLLSIHLKSRCWDRALTHTSSDCQKLSQQVPPLEAWIDARASENVPFLVLGDWNRRFEAQGDTFWPEINDSIPANADLLRVTEGRTSECWDREFPLYIDHIVLDRQSSAWIVTNSFTQLVYDEDVSFKRKLSDHCPISVQLSVGEVSHPSGREEMLARIKAMEEELSKLRSLVESLPVE